MTSAERLASRRDQALDWLLRVHQAPQDTQLRAELERWCASDAANAKAFRTAERVWLLTGDLTPETAEQWPQPSAIVVSLPVKRRSVHRWWVSAAAVACLVVALAPGLSLRLQADYYTSRGETRDITLADGSVVQLDSDSAIAVDYAQGQRDVRLLGGQAFFEVVPDKTRPFRVKVDDLRVTVTGTAFNVKLRPQQVAVDVQHGSVKVDDTRHAQVLAEALTAGQRLRYIGGQAQVQRFEPTQAAAWRKGQLIADDLPVADVVKALAERLPGKVWLDDAELGARRVTGVYDLRNPQAALAAVVRPYGGSVRSYGPVLMIVSKP